jgi:hypothetical protein
MTNKEIYERGERIFGGNMGLDSQPRKSYSVVQYDAYTSGAIWANGQNADQISKLEAQNAELLAALETALAHGIQTREGRDFVFNILEKYKK